MKEEITNEPYNSGINRKLRTNTTETKFDAIIIVHWKTLIK